MYKDKERQKEANKRASQRRRDKLKGVTHKPESVIPNSENVIPEQVMSKSVQKRLARMNDKPWPGPLTKEQQTSRKGFNE